ncbi:aldehyde dehydrogenase family protein [Sphingorhabdus lutea]|nr:aldehyde dehydrogenase family protein [Sphingorhabdus lutea]
MNPANNEIIGAIGLADLALTQQALEAAEAAFPTWSDIAVNERAQWMHKLRDAIIQNEEKLRHYVHIEMGKPWAATADDYQMLVDSLEYYAAEIQNIKEEYIDDSAGTHSHVISREPVGVVAAFLAWNFPLLNLAYKLGPAMAAGCPIVIKPSLQTPLSTYAVGELCAEIGLPDGAVNIICGSDAAIGDAISASPIPQMLTLIGSTQTGKHVIRTGATSIKRYSMELGGDAPVLVFEDADLDNAADVICALKFGNSGQICVAPNRVYAHSTIAEKLTQKIVERAENIKVGFDKEADINMGPLIDQKAWARIDGLVKDAVSRGASLLAGGGYPDGLEQGSFYAPTVISGVTKEMQLGVEEVFGPIISMMQPFEDEVAILCAANDTDAGLTAYVFTSDSERADRCARALRFGEVQINGVRYAINLPHVGIKQSGIGVDCSHLALDDYLVTKRVSRALNIKGGGA